MGWGAGLKIFFFKKSVIYVILRLYTEFRSPTVHGTGQKVCVQWARWCGGGAWCGGT